MKSKEIISWIFLLLLCYSSFAQTNIIGKIISKEGKPLTHATVLLLKPKDSSLVKGSLSDDAGIFMIDNVATGRYIISAAYIGYDPFYTDSFNISPDKPKHDVGTIQLLATKDLSAVIVTAKKPLYEMKIDRMVINVAAAITYTGISALDVLQRSPGVIVNLINNSLTINGKDGVIIMINGKRNYMDIGAVIQMLAGMPSGSVEKIEVITTPPANFDAEGNAGIINIVLKSNDQFGTNGSYSLTTGYNTGIQTSASGNMNHRKGKINLFGNYSYWSNHMIQDWTNYHAVTNPQGFNENFSSDDRHGILSSHNMQLGMDYELSKKTIIGVLLSGNYRDWTMTSNNNASIVLNTKLDTGVTIVNDELHTTLNYGANLNFQHMFSHEGKITFNADYLYYLDQNPSSYQNSYFDGEGNFLYTDNVQSNKTTPLQFVILAADFSRRISKKTEMEAGLKLTLSEITNDISVSNYLQNGWIVDSTLSGNHTQNESISAAYASFNIKFSEKNSIKFGLRYEYTQTSLSALVKADEVNRKYGDLFPSFFYLHSFTSNSSLNFTYSRRIYRPGFYDLAPWVLFLDPKTFQTGNPYLQPSITDAMSVSYTLKSYIVTLSYSYIAPTISRMPIVDTTSNKLISVSQNAKNAQYISLTFNLPFTIAKWWNMQNGISLNWQQNNTFYKEAIIIDGKTLYFNSVQNFVLPKDFSISISGGYGSASNWGLYSYKPWGYLDIGFQKKLSNKRSTLTFNVNNVLNTNKMVSSADMPAQNLITRSTNIYGRTGVSLSFTHNFGSDKVKQKRDRSTGDEDERNRGY
jgi:outer membrane receptor protein involved in Fe transport